MEDKKLTGLTQAEVTARVKAGQINKVKDDKRKTKKQIIASHTLTYFNFLNLFLAILIIISGQYKNLLFLGVVISNSAIGIFQELKVKSLIDKLSVITALKANVIRDGAHVSLPINEIVMDDVLVLASGDQICTDSIVLSSDGMEVNESMLTGESKPVKKKQGDHLFSGSFIVAGNGIGQVEHVGDDNYAVQLAQKAKTKKRATSEMQNTIKKIIQVVSVAIIPIGLLLYYSQYQAHNGDFRSALVSTAAGVIGMIPEGLVLLTSVSFVLGVGRLAKKRAMVQEMEAIEALARVNVLCTDKTGTITTGNLEVVKVLPFGNASIDTVKTVMNEISFAFDDTNATQDALMHYFQKTDSWQATAKIPFSSARKYRAITFAGQGSYCLGAPEYLVPKGSPVLDQIAAYSEDGYRVLLLGQTDALDAEHDTIGTVTPLGAIVISDVIRTDAKDTFAYFAKEGVAIKVISGDNPATVSSIAVKAGLKGGERYVDATTLPKDPVALGKALMQFTVFGRVKPEQKQDFVKAFQANKKTVAMVGDGVNDVLAIKDADCGIAMAAGSDAAKQAAHIVLLDSDFKSMKDIVKEGRMIISNIERVSALYLTKTIYSMLLCIIFILLRRDYPFTPLQLGLIGMAAIGIPSFCLTLEHNDNVTSDGFLKHVLQVSLPGALTMVTSMLIIQILAAVFHFDTMVTSTFCLVIGGIISLLVVVQVCSPLNAFRKLLITVITVLFFAVILVLHKFYGIHSIFMWWTLLMIPFVVLIMMLLYWYSRLVRKCQIWWAHYKENKNNR